ncbi:hypothetical protein [Clostridium butyricum]|uniref:hypothetical protein n=1 Tax=Clostridium butyricum TaxID=1492 RepID=UPI00325BF770
MKLDLTRREALSLLDLLQNLDNLDLTYLKQKRGLNFDEVSIGCVKIKIEDMDTGYNKEEELKESKRFLVRIPLKSNVDSRYRYMIDTILKTSLMQESEIETRKDE